MCVGGPARRPLCRAAGRGGEWGGERRGRKRLGPLSGAWGFPHHAPVRVLSRGRGTGLIGRSSLAPHADSREGREQCEQQWESGETGSCESRVRGDRCSLPSSAGLRKNRLRLHIQRRDLLMDRLRVEEAKGHPAVASILLQIYPPAAPIFHSANPVALSPPTRGFQPHSCEPRHCRPNFG